MHFFGYGMTQNDSVLKKGTQFWSYDSTDTKNKRIFARDKEFSESKSQQESKTEFKSLA